MIELTYDYNSLTNSYTIHAQMRIQDKPLPPGVRMPKTVSSDPMRFELADEEWMDAELVRNAMSLYGARVALDPASHLGTPEAYKEWIVRELATAIAYSAVEKALENDPTLITDLFQAKN